MSDNNQQRVETTDFFIKKLEITGFSASGEAFAFDVSAIFEELNIFDNMFFPCMSGNIVIRDAINLIDKLSLDGNEFINIEINKSEDSPEIYNIKKTFRIHKVQNRTNVSATAQIYTLHFTSKEHLLSENLKVQKYYKGTYHDISLKILQEYLGVEKYYLPFDIDSMGIHHVVIPNLTPFQAIDWLARRSIWINGKPDFIFFEIKDGYCFTSLSRLLDLDYGIKINFRYKDIKQTNDKLEFFGARDLRIISQFTITDSIMNGVFGGTFIGFDTLTRTYREKIFTFNELYKPGRQHHANPYPNIPITRRIPEIKSDIPPTTEFQKSRVTTYPFAYPRTTSDGEYIKELNPELTVNIDNTHEYFFQRKHSFGNLAQKRLQITMPGNFALFTGLMVEFDVPKYSALTEEDDINSVDVELSGRYIITGVRHTITYTKHETLIEVASDSSLKVK